jgi:hypothetical protein
MRAERGEGGGGGGGKGLVAVFMSASCERHNKYLWRLMQHLEV